MNNSANEEEKFEIKTHDFEENIEHLKVFLEQKDSDLEIRKVNGSKDVGEWFAEWFKGGGIGKDHKVTGDELNEVTTQVQSNLMVINNNQKEMKAEFGRVYSALKALDKDYIQAILISEEGTRKTNKKLEESQAVIKTNQKNIKIAQGDIEKAHKTLQKTVQSLQKFKEKLDQYKHMSDIDKMWSDVQKQQALLEKSSDDMRTLFDLASEHTSSITELNETRDFILGLEHLPDIDLMWSELANSDRKLKVLSDSVDKLVEDLSNRLKNKEETITKLEVSFASKIKIAYFFAGGSMGLAIVELILILTRMM